MTWDIDEIQLSKLDIKGSLRRNTFQTTRHHFKVSKTCGGCPTQYDIEYNGKTYYGRLRWGYFYAARKPLDKPIFQYQFSDQWKGAFSSIEQETKFLTKALDAIIRRAKRKAKEVPGN